MQYDKKTFGDYAREGVLYLGLTFPTVFAAIFDLACSGGGSGPEPEPPLPPEEQDLTEDEGVLRVKEVLGDRNVIVEKYGKMIRIFDPVKGIEVEYNFDLANEPEGVYGEYMSDTDGLTNDQLETINNVFSGPGYPAMITVGKGTKTEVESETNSEADDWGL